VRGSSSLLGGGVACSSGVGGQVGLNFFEPLVVVGGHIDLPTHCHHRVNEEVLFVSMIFEACMWSHCDLTEEDRSQVMYNLHGDRQESLTMSSHFFPSGVADDDDLLSEGYGTLDEEG
jgi:hypothetical protein